MAGAPKELTGVELGKRVAARAAVDEFLRPRGDGGTMPIGIGSGSTVPYAVERIAERVRDEGLKVACVPTSHQALQLIVEAGLTLTALEQHPVLDVCLDGADEVDLLLNSIKGGGACQLQEKIVASNARNFVIIADMRKKADILGEKWTRGVPISVVPMAAKPVMRCITETGGTPKLRMSSDKVGPLLTDDGHFVVDADYGKIADPALLNRRLRQIVGVVETGLFCGLATKAFFGHADGTVTTRTAPVPPPWTQVLRGSGPSEPGPLYLNVVTGLHAWPHDSEGDLPRGWAVRRSDTLQLAFAADVLQPERDAGREGREGSVVYLNLHTGDLQAQRPTDPAAPLPPLARTAAGSPARARPDAKRQRTG